LLSFHQELDDLIHFVVHASDFVFEVLNFLGLLVEMVRFTLIFMLEILDLFFEFVLKVSKICILNKFVVLELGVDVFEFSLEVIVDFLDHLLNQALFL